VRYQEEHCEGKQLFKSMRLAMETAHKQSKRHHGKYNAYHCRKCSGFHIGSILGIPKSQKPRLQEEEHAIKNN